MADTRYPGFENSNSYRNYPFAETADLKDVNGVELAADVFVDAFLYPVLTSMADVRLTGIDLASGRVVAKAGDVVLEGTESDGTVDLYDDFGRHAGTIKCGPGWEREKAAARTREFEGLVFSSAVSSPIVHDGVLSFTDEDGNVRTTRRNVTFEGDGCITPVLTGQPYGTELSFDVQDDYVPGDGLVVRQMVFVAMGQTIFDIADQSDDTVLLTTPLLSREDVCWQAHQEEHVAKYIDTCEDSNDTCPAEPVPFKFEEIWKCPSEIGTINLVAEDVLGLKNAVHVIPVEGQITARPPQIVDGMNAEAAAEQANKLLKRPVQSGNGIRISVPGL